MQSLVKKHYKFILYGLFSVMVTVIDTAIVWVLKFSLGAELIWANTAGVAAGFIIHYALSSKRVFGAEYGTKGFLIYLSTFLAGLFLADIIIHYVNEFALGFFNSQTAFMTAKAVSVILPFFFMYVLRRKLYGRFLKKEGEN